MSRYAASLELLGVKVRCDDATLDAQPVSIALVPPGVAPDSLDWHQAAWVGVAGPRRVAQLLVGPGGDVSYIAGTYDVLVRVQDTLETPVTKAGSITFV